MFEQKNVPGAFGATGARATATDSARFMSKVYGWMTGGLALTAAVSAITLSDQALLAVVAQPMIFFPLMLVELGLVFWLSARVLSMSLMTAMSVFMGYAALNGLTLSLILYAYTGASVAQAFIVTAGAFGALSLFGYATKRDLSAMGAFMFVGLVGIIIASIVNIFMASEALSFAVSILGVLIFAGLTAFDTQRIKAMGAVAGPDGVMAQRLALSGALALYLDFINMFIFLLQLMGNRD
ncbi:MAG: Bax inhibitor-1/YccA family protein [Nitrospinae bacterium]|nr:Bax inhibitor-1/YccA family protein [Nitrospinota bacterium]